VKKLNVCKVGVGEVGEWIKSWIFILMVSCSKTSERDLAGPYSRIFGMTNLKQF